MRRVVITGLGMVSPLGCGVANSWRRVLAGHSAAATISRFDAAHLATDYACEVPRGDGTDGTFNPDDWMEPKERRKVDDFILYAVAAAEQAVSDADWKPRDERSRERTGVMIGSGIGGLHSIAEAALVLRDRGPRRISPFFIPGALINLASGQVSIRYGFKGPNHSVVDRLFDGRTRDRRCRASDRLRRRGRHGGGRRREPDHGIGNRGFQRLQGALDRLEGKAVLGVASVRRGSRRIRHGRRIGRRGA